MTVNGQRILWHLGGSAHFVTMLALIPEQELGIVVSYNTPPADDGRVIVFRFMEQFFPVERGPLTATPLPGWNERAAIFNGVYAPARSNHSSEQLLVRYIATAPVEILEGRLTFNGWEFVETASGVFHQINGDRVLAFQEDENGMRWLFVGVLAYFQVPWYATFTVLLAVAAGYLLVLLSLLVAWMVRRKSGAASGWRTIVLAGGLGLYSIGLLTGLVLQLLQYADTLVYPQDAATLLMRLYWLTVPWTLAVLAVVIYAWLRHEWTLVWRIHYSLSGAVAVMFLWLLWRANLI